MIKNHKNLHFPTIDILRGFAAISVVVYHVIELMEWKSFPMQGMMLWFRIGWMGVDMFFVISGLVIGLAAFSEIDRSGKSEFRITFLKRRCARIIPLHYLTLLIFVVLVAPELVFDNFWKNLLAHLLFIHNLFPGLDGAINGSNWSLGTEMQFYLLIALMAPWLKCTKSWKFVLLFVSIAWFWRYLAVAYVPIDGPMGVFPLFFASNQLPGMLDEFAIGLLMARFFSSDRGAGLAHRLTNSIWLLPIMTMTVIWGWLVFLLYWKYAGYWDHPRMVIMFRTMLASAFGALIFVACLVKLNKVWTRILAPLTYLGTISYGIYLWHLPVLLSFKRLNWLSAERALPWVICCTILFAAVSWHFFEKPFIERFKKKAA